MFYRARMTVISKKTELRNIYYKMLAYLFKNI